MEAKRRKGIVQAIVITACGFAILVVAAVLTASQFKHHVLVAAPELPAHKSAPWWRSGSSFLAIVGAATSVFGLIKLIFETLSAARDFFSRQPPPRHQG
jgi:hypothetical protein